MEAKSSEPLPKLVRRCFEFAPGQTVTCSGTYRCATCSTKVTFQSGETLPDCPLCGPHIRVWVGKRCSEAAS